MSENKMCNRPWVHLPHWSEHPIDGAYVYCAGKDDQ